jgi:nucleoid DNA-binding protein
MNRLIEHIERLLPEHDCVVVPGLGGFMLHDVPARTDKAGELFHPRGKELRFNAQLTFNDGILVQSYQEAYGLSFEAAVEQVLEEVKQLRQKLDERHYVLLGKLGTLLKNEENGLEFRPDNRNLFCAETYGLSSFIFLTLQNRQRALKNKDKPHRDDYIHIRLHRHTLQKMGLSHCCLFGRTADTQTSRQLDEAGYQEAFLLKNYVTASPVSSGTLPVNLLLPCLLRRCPCYNPPRRPCKPFRRQ